MRAIYLYNPVVVEINYGSAHPFRLERLWLTEYLSRQLGLFAADDCVRSFEQAERGDLETAHEAGFLDALEIAEHGLLGPGMMRYGLGSGDNPIFPGLWDYALYTAGGSLAAADLLLEGVTERVFHPGGGLHHALRGRASGFCYVNDVALAIHRMLAAEKRVLYFDVDAHHGDGVQEAFLDLSSVLTISIHQDGRTLFPGTGFVNDVGVGQGEGYSVNVPLLPHMSDEEYLRVCDEIVTPLVTAFQPDLIVTELGADALVGDPLTNLELTLEGWWAILERVVSWGIPWMAVGGGGYDLANAMRAWSLAWAAMLEQKPGREMPPPPERLPGAAAGMDWPEDLWAPIAPRSGPRPDGDVISAVIQQVRSQVFPYHGLAV